MSSFYFLLSIRCAWIFIFQFGVLFGALGVLFGVLGVLSGVLSVLVGLNGVLTFDWST